jgi:hypothetical protein
VIALPTHEPCGADAFGELVGDGVAVCRERDRRFVRVRTEDWRGFRFDVTATSSGCGGRFLLCAGCGARTCQDGTRCPRCGGAPGVQVPGALDLRAPSRGAGGAVYPLGWWELLPGAAGR